MSQNNAVTISNCSYSSSTSGDFEFLRVNVGPRLKQDEISQGLYVMSQQYKHSSICMAHNDLDSFTDNRGQNKA